ncbi:ribosomal RNA small subunit methyltransferase A [Candidatus Fermentibacteria bacterium]|nr:MAG: ribosomal RNA small subunit methyltransferase A [Candidatus Fermentibacteria bacterium]
MNRSETRKALAELGLKADKSLGQNFLINPLAAGKIVRALGTEPLQILEIGPGLGALTEKLLAFGHRVSAIELSEVLAERLTVTMPEVPVVHGDFLRTNPSDIPGFPFNGVASNLPYNISSQAVLKLCAPEYSRVDRAVIMLQREMAERLCCLEGGRNYGRLSLMVWPWFTVRKLFDLEPGEFMPEPSVVSRVVVMERKKETVMSREEYRIYGRVVKAAFSSRRKKIINCLARAFGKDSALQILKAAEVDPDLRAERIAPEKFAEIAGKAEL